MQIFYKQTILRKSIFMIQKWLFVCPFIISSPPSGTTDDWQSLTIYMALSCTL